MTPSQETRQVLLRAEARRLEHELASIATPDPAIPGNWKVKFPDADSTMGTSSHARQEEEADLREEFEANIAETTALEERLAEVTRALKRMEDGSYGTCLRCHQAIPPERLEANPAAEYDIEHQPKG